MKLRFYTFVSRNLLVWIVCSVVLQIVFSNELVKLASNVDDLERIRSILQEENVQLQQNLAQLTSLQSLEVRSQNTGLVKSSSILSIGTLPFVVAVQPSVQ